MYFSYRSLAQSQVAVTRGDEAGIASLIPSPKAHYVVSKIKLCVYWRNELFMDSPCCYFGRYFLQNLGNKKHKMIRASKVSA